MIDYLGGVTGSLLSTIFIAFIIAALGYLVGAIEIKGISLGTAGVLLVALAYGVLCNYVPAFEIKVCHFLRFDSAQTARNL